MPRNPRTARHRALLRALVTMTTAALLVVMTALPALASAGTRPTQEDNPYLIGSLQELGTAAIVGIVVAIIVWVLMPAAAETADDEHH